MVVTTTQLGLHTELVLGYPRPWIVLLTVLTHSIARVSSWTSGSAIVSATDSWIYFWPHDKLPVDLSLYWVFQHFDVYALQVWHWECRPSQPSQLAWLLIRSISWSWLNTHPICKKMRGWKSYFTKNVRQVLMWVYIRLRWVFWNTNLQKLVTLFGNLTRKCNRCIQPPFETWR